MLHFFQQTRVRPGHPLPLRKHKWGLLVSCDEDVGTVWSDFENYVPQKTLFQIRGKLWGKRVFLNRKILSPRFTGQTFFLYLPQQNGSAHPRLRGADRAALVALPVTRGSSPLTRGGRGEFGVGEVFQGAHPRLRGADRHGRRGERIVRAHPRLRGADCPLARSRSP